MYFLLQSIIELEGRWPEVHETYPQKYKDKNSTIDAEVMLQSKKRREFAGTGKRDNKSANIIKIEAFNRNKFSNVVLFFQKELRSKIKSKLCFKVTENINKDINYCERKCYEEQKI